MTTFGGATIGYNTMGCPTAYEGKSLTWTRGKLSRMFSGTVATGTSSYNFTYNVYGQRVGKTYTYLPGKSATPQVGQLTASNCTYYYDHAGRLIAQETANTNYQMGESSESIVFLYDESGIIGMVRTVNGTANTYYFHRNLLGDVVAIYDTSGNMVAKYLYDAWGNCTISSETTNTAVANANPIRYRGYYYDDDTGLYYCNARYYSPKWRRFISPDDTFFLHPENVNGLNLYCYCGNDPLNRCDPSGCFWDYIFDAAFIVWGVCDLVAGGYKDWKNWVSLGVDLVFAVLPFVPTGAGQVIKVGNRIDDAKDIANTVRKLDDFQDATKVTVIGRNMERVRQTAVWLGRQDDLYVAWQGYDIAATGVKRFLHNGISMLHDGAWMFGKLRSGYTVVDIGIKAAQTGFGLYYGIERVVIGLWQTRNYWKLLINYLF